MCSDVVYQAVSVPAEIASFVRDMGCSDLQQKRNVFGLMSVSVGYCWQRSLHGTYSPDIHDDRPCRCNGDWNDGLNGADGGVYDPELEFSFLHDTVEARKL